ncbi:ribosomal protein L12 family protein [Actinidia rufa]|uniref:Large ribosomal subunit protein bL12c n=1 Tax=Actinidia rufa TaxID=165716 RepID=A0A7J0EHJ7_9ERIC|nr:ribosomal protein L12 family protein [Actinidia rufa]
MEVHELCSRIHIVCARIEAESLREGVFDHAGDGGDDAWDGGGGGASKGGGAVKVEKTAFDLKPEGGFDAAAKIKIIREVRACTDLGLKEAKDLVEKAPTLLKKGVTKEEAEKIIEKMKVVGAKVIME